MPSTNFLISICSKPIARVSFAARSMKNALFSSFFALGTVGGWILTQSTSSGDVNQGLVQYKYAILPYRKFHCGDETILRLSYLHNGIAYTGKMTFLYWIRALKSLGANDQCRARKSVAQNHEHIFFGAIRASWCYRQSTAKCQWFNFLIQYEFDTRGNIWASNDSGKMWYFKSCIETRAIN